MSVSLEKEVKIPSTEEIVQAMMVENTGRNFLDSGDAYGRNWQRNQGKEFKDSPTGWLHVDAPRSDYGPRHKPDKGSEWYLEYFRPTFYFTISLYHFLVDRVDYAPDLQAQFDAMVKEDEDQAENPWDEKSWSELIAGFPEWLSQREKPIDEEAYRYLAGGDEPDPEFFDVRGAGGGGPSNMWGDYTYNVENFVSQDFIWNIISVDDEAILILQIHGGCDARGGFTAPKLFRIYEYEVLDYCRADLFCDNRDCGSYWSYDGPSSSEGYGRGQEEVRSLEEYFSMTPEQARQRGYIFTKLNALQGAVIADPESNTVSCPECGNGYLGVSPTCASG